MLGVVQNEVSRYCRVAVSLANSMHRRRCHIIPPSRVRPIAPNTHARASCLSNSTTYACVLAHDNDANSAVRCRTATHDARRTDTAKICINTNICALGTIVARAHNTFECTRMNPTRMRRCARSASPSSQCRMCVLENRNRRKMQLQKRVFSGICCVRGARARMIFASTATCVCVCPLKVNVARASDRLHARSINTHTHSHLDPVWRGPVLRVLIKSTDALMLARQHYCLTQNRFIFIHKNQYGRRTTCFQFWQEHGPRNTHARFDHELVVCCRWLGR